MKQLLLSMIKMISKFAQYLLLAFILVAMVLPLMPATPALAAYTLQDSYDDTPTGHVSTYGANRWYAQTWTTSSAYDITRVDLKLFRNESPGTVTVSIKATSGGKPNGADLGVVTANGNFFTTSTNGAWYSFVPATPVSLSDATQYAIVIKVLNGDSTNRIEWKTKLGYADAALWRTLDGGSSWDDQNSDAMFKTYSGYDPPSVTTGYPTNVEDTTATIWAYLETTGGQPTTVSFQYGLTDSYGSETSGSLVASGAWTSKPLSDLTVGQTYHYRAKAVNAVDTVYGSDKTLRTTDFTAGEIDTNLDYGGLTRNGGRAVFYTKGLYWIFYVRNVAPAGYGKDGVEDFTYQQFGFRTYNESAFSSFTAIRPVPKSYGQSATSTWFDGTYLHYITADWANTYYRRGTPNANGTITWSAPEQTVGASMLWKYPNFTVDSNGYPVIGYWEVGVGRYVIRSTSNTGYWITDASFSKTFTGDVNAITVLPLSDGRIYAVMAGAYGPIYGYLWNGSSWGAVENIGSKDTEDGFTMQAVVVNDNVYLVFAEAYVFHVYFIWRDASDGIWKGQTEVYTDTTLQGGAGLVYDSTGDMLYIFYANQDTDIVYSKTWQGGTFGSQITVANESAEGLISQGNGVFLSFQSSYYTLGGKLPLVYLVSNTPPSILKFNTIVIQTAPEVTTDLPANITQTSATLQGTLVDDNGYSTSVRFQWGTTLSYGNDTVWQSGYTDGQLFSQAISGLTPNTTFHYRAQGKWADGTIGSGMDRTFTTTSPGIPTVTTGTAVNITTSGATLQGTLTSLGGYSPVYVYFQYGVTTSYGASTAEQTKTSTGGFSQVISGLTPSTFYHFRVVVRYSTTGYGSGSDATFTTSTVLTEVGELPVVVPAPEEIPGFFEETGEITEMPWYDLFYRAAVGDVDSPGLGWSTTTLYGVMAIFAGIGLGVGVAIATGSALLAAIAVGVGLSVGAGQGVIGWWVIIAYALIGGALLIVYRSI